MSIKTPYPYFGGKARVASEVWKRFGNVPNYIEPFFGGGAVLLKRPHKPGTETINDINAWLCNFWRAVKSDPDAVAYHASDPISELDLHARNDWMFGRDGVEDFIETVRSDPEWYDVKSAGWWVWGQCAAITANWGRVGSRSIINLSCRNGVFRESSSTEKNVNTRTSHESAVRNYMNTLCERLCRVHICCGDFARVLTPVATTHVGTPTAVFLDPLYGVEDREQGVYNTHDSLTVAGRCLDWCLEHGSDDRFRIALCGYDGEHNVLEDEGWDKFAWKAHGGYCSLTKDKDKDKDKNRKRERIWFSPGCIKPNSGFGLLST